MEIIMDNLTRNSGLFDFEMTLSKKSEEELKKMVKSSTLDYEVYKNNGGFYKVLAHDKRLNKKRELLDSDFMFAMVSSHVSETQLFSNKRDLYQALCLFAYNQGLIEYKKVEIQPSIDNEWSKTED